MRSVSSSWTLEHRKHSSTTEISSQFGNVGPQYSVPCFPKTKVGIIIPLTVLSELREKNSVISEYCLLLKHHKHFITEIQ